MKKKYTIEHSIRDEGFFVVKRVVDGFTTNEIFGTEGKPLDLNGAEKLKKYLESVSS